MRRKIQEIHFCINGRILIRGYLVATKIIYNVNLNEKVEFIGMTKWYLSANTAYPPFNKYAENLPGAIEVTSPDLLSLLET